MSNPFLRRGLPFVMVGVATLLLIASIRLPLWHMRLEAPQYRDEEALKIAVFPNRYGGDMREISVLNQYIGVHVPRTLPQFSWLPYLLAGGAVLGLAASFFKVVFRRRALVVISGAIVAGLLTAAIQAKSQMHDIGHKRDQRTVLAGMHDFTPPFIGTARIAQFTVTSGFGLGAWLIGAAMVLQLGAAFLSRKTAGAIVCPAPAEKPTESESLDATHVAYQI